MKRIAIIGGGISGLTAAYELELARKRGADIDWHLYEASDRLGGIIETTRYSTPEGEWILEGGPDGWVSEKPWARELAIELGLEDQLIYSNDADRKTYILLDGKLQAMPDRMRMFVPEDLSTLDDSPLFSVTAKQAYADEITRAEELKASAPNHDESVASFVLRHFGEEVLEKVAAPLLSGVFGGDVNKLSVRSVLAPFVAMEREHGSLVLALQCKAAERGSKPPQPIFTSLSTGMGSLSTALQRCLPPDRLHLRVECNELLLENYTGEAEWSFWIDKADRNRAAGAFGLSGNHIAFFEEFIFALPLSLMRRLLKDLDPVSTWFLPSSGSFASLAPRQASSAVLISYCWPKNIATTLAIPQGFGFLVPQQHTVRHSTPVISTEAKRSGETSAFAASATREQVNEPNILAATFTNQKFPQRTPPGARAIRVFFGSDSTEYFANTPDSEVAKQAFIQLQSILGPLPDPDHTLTTVHRWPRSLPQYEVGHLDRMAQLDELVARIPGLHLLGNSYRGVGLPDLIRDARSTARKLLSTV